MKKTSLIASIFIFIFLSFISQPAISSGTFTSKIKVLGCHKNNDTCFITFDSIDQSEFTNTNCTRNNFRWRADSVNGEKILSLAMMAFSLNKRMLVRSSGCFENSTTYPDIVGEYIL